MRPGAGKQWFGYIHLLTIIMSIYLLQQHLLRASYVHVKTYLSRSKHLWAVFVLSHLKNVLKHLGCVLELAKALIWLHPSKIKLSTYMLQQHPLTASCVCLNTYLRRLGSSLTHLEGVLEQAKTVIWPLTSVKEQAFNSYASTTSFESILCEFHSGFGPSWKGF